MKLVRSMLAFLLLISACLSAADKPIVGKWRVVAEGPNGDNSLDLTVNDDNGQLSGTIKRLSDKGGDWPLESPQLDGDVFSFKIKIQDEHVGFKAKLSGTTMQGTWTGPVFSGVIKATKQD